MSIENDVSSMIATLEKLCGDRLAFSPQGVLTGLSRVDLLSIDPKDVDYEADKVFDALPDDCYNVRIVS